MGYGLSMSNKEDKTIIAEAISFSAISNAGKKKQACLVQYSGTGLGKRYMFTKDKITLGRSPNAGIHIHEASISREHAVFHLVGDQVEVEDKGSSNGTFVNDKRVEGRVTLKDQDILRIGTALLKFFDGNNIDGIIQDKIYRMATIDAGTQIFNKQYLMDTLQSEVTFSQTYQRPLSIIYFDLDHFKKVNDTYGHNAGDQILREGSAIVKNMIRKDDIVGRFGGEEFIVVLPNTDKDTAADLAERMRKALNDYVFKIEQTNDGKKSIIEHQQTISLGVAELSPEMSPKDLLESADKKLYTSKQTGRNKVTV